MLLAGALALSMVLTACHSDQKPEKESNVKEETGEVDIWKMKEPITVKTAKNVYDVNIYHEGQTLPKVMFLRLFRCQGAHIFIPAVLPGTGLFDYE